MLRNATVQGPSRPWLDEYIARGYIPEMDYDHPVTNTVCRAAVTKTLEYAYDDWCIAQVAAKLGRSEDAAKLEKAAQNYRNVFDPETGFARGRMSDGSWKPDPNLYDTHGQGFIEGNSWNYSMYVPHDPDG